MEHADNHPVFQIHGLQIQHVLSLENVLILVDRRTRLPRQDAVVGQRDNGSGHEVRVVLVVGECRHGFLRNHVLGVYWKSEWYVNINAVETEEHRSDTAKKGENGSIRNALQELLQPELLLLRFDSKLHGGGENKCER